MSIVSLLFLLAGGVATGTIGAMLGIGGGIFLVPFLVLVAGLPMHQAIATSIIAVIATSSAGASLNVRQGKVNLRLGMILEVMTVLGALAGGLTANTLSGDDLVKIFAALLLGVAVLMVWRMRMNPGEPPATGGVLDGRFVDEASGNTLHYGVRRVPGTMAVSFLAGNISGLLGVGGGIFKVPAMSLLSGVPIKAATATSNFMIGVTAAASAFIYYSHGNVDGLVAAPAALGALAGSHIGVRLNRMLDARVLNWIFAGVLTAVSLHMFLR